MNLSELLSRGTAISVGLKKVPVAWVDEDESGKSTEVKFDIYVRTNIPFAANDRIFGGTLQGGDDSRNSRIISEMVRFGDGTEQMAVEDAANLKPALGWVLVAAVLKNMPKPVVNEKKVSRRSKRSGTN